MLGNLLNNALQHTSPHTQIILRAVADAESVTISVIDNGTGIPADEVSHLFERFYRADRARNRTGGHKDGHEQGSGLGLSISYQLALLHHGMLSVQSRVGVGTTFNLRLPRYPQNIKNAA